AKNWDFKNRSCTSGVEEGVVCADELEVRATIIVHCLDRLPEPDEEFHAARARANPQFGGSLHYRRMDVRDRDGSNQVMSAIAEDKNRLDGLVVAAGVNHVGGATAHSAADIERVISTNYIGAFTSATAAVAQMLNKKTRGFEYEWIDYEPRDDIVYNLSAAAMIQLTRSFTMEWGKIDKEGRGEASKLP
ncbi:hypothetical protein N7537_005251, partial [Penicillium hordei]